MKMLIGKQFTFDSAHFLHNYVGKCANLHGHTYKLEVIIEGEVDENGMVVDFVDVDRVVKEVIIDKLDHRFLNDIIPQSTAENIVIWIWNQLKDKLQINQLTLWETPKCFVVYKGL